MLATKKGGGVFGIGTYYERFIFRELGTRMTKSAAYNKRFGEIGVEVIVRTAARRLTVSDSPNCVQLRPNFAKSQGRYMPPSDNTAK